MSWTLTHRFLNAAGRPASGWVYFDLSTSPTLTDVGTFVGTADRIRLAADGSLTVTGLPSEPDLFLLVYPRIVTGDPTTLGPVTIPTQPDGSTLNLGDLITDWPSTPVFVPWELWGPVLDRIDTIEAGGGGDPTAVKLTGDQTITGVKTFTDAPVVPDGSWTVAKTSGLQAALDGKAPTTRTITAGTGLTGGGDLTANRALDVSYGTTAGTAAQGNDTRLSDARTPTAHTATHAAGGADELALSAAQTTSGVFAVGRLGLGDASSATVLYGDGTWKTAPTGGGGGTAPGAWQDYVLDAGHTVDSAADNPKWRNMNDGTVQVYCGRVLAGPAVSAYATYVATPAGFPALARQADFSNNIQIRVDGSLVLKGAAAAGGQIPGYGQGNVFTVMVA